MKNPEIDLNAFARERGRYPADAYRFVLETVNFAASKLAAPRHLAAAELLEAWRELLDRQFGPLAATVQETWQVRQALDVGTMVFELIELGVLKADDKDSIADFDVVFPLVRPCPDPAASGAVSGERVQKID